MGSVSTRQLYRLCGMPSRSVLWAVVNRHKDKLGNVLLHVQKGRGGSIWKSEAVQIIKAIYEAQRSKWPYRQWKASDESRIRNLPRLDPTQRAKLEEQMKALEAQWVKETDEGCRAAFERDLRFLRRVKKRDDRNRKL